MNDDAPKALAQALDLPIRFDGVVNYHASIERLAALGYVVVRGDELAKEFWRGVRAAQDGTIERAAEARRLK